MHIKIVKPASSTAVGGCAVLGRLRCVVYYNSQYISVDADVLELTVLSSAGARDVIVDPARSLAVPFNYTAPISCSLAADVTGSHGDDDAMWWTWFVNGQPINASSTGQLSSHLPAAISGLCFCPDRKQKSR